MKFHELACSFMRLYAVKFFDCAAHKNFAVLVYQNTPPSLKVLGRVVVAAHAMYFKSQLGPIIRLGPGLDNIN